MPSRLFQRRKPKKIPMQMPKMAMLNPSPAMDPAVYDALRNLYEPLPKDEG